MNGKVIATTHFRRPDCTRLFFEALSRCYGIEDYTVLTSVDFDDRFENACRQCGIVAREFSVKMPGNVHVVLQSERLGIDVHKVRLLRAAFDLSNYVIFLEDDTPPSPDALRYFEACNDLFRDDPLCMSISGYNRVTDCEAHEIDPYELQRRDGFCPWGWATWRDRYEMMYGANGVDYLAQHGDHTNGKFDWHGEQHVKNGRYTVRPALARTQHSAWEDAEHTPSKEFWEANEYNPVWAGVLSLPDPSPSVWHLSDAPIVLTGKA